MILDNGVIRPMDRFLPSARALAIAADQVAGGVGVHESALPSPEVVDLGGRCVLPGFNDAHVHFAQWAIAQREVQLAGLPAAAALDRIRTVASGMQPGAWLRGRGWRAGDWAAGSEPTRAELDAAVGDRAAALISRDAHSVLLSTAALALAGGDLDTPGGIVERDAAGAPTGILRETACWRFLDRHARPSDAELLDAMRQGQGIALRRGITAVHDFDGDLGALELHQRLAAESSLQLRVLQTQPASRLPHLRALGLRAGFGGPHLALGHLKVFLDGTLGSGTARLLDGTGVSVTSRADLEETIREAAEAGFPVAVHAIGDAANREALDAFEATREVWEPRRLRQRIEHAQCLHPDDILRFSEIGVTASVQFSHAPADRDLADERWAERLDGAYAYKSLLDAGTRLANGSDAPIEALDPLAGIRAAVARTLDDRPGWRTDQALPMWEAVEAMTVAPAWLAGDERRRGRLIPGQVADLVVLDRDPFATPVDELGEISVVATMVGGRWLHNPPPWD
jgi:predicted amidohydrolase YtcJ